MTTTGGPPQPPSDALLVSRALEHDEQAWDLLLGRYADYIYAIALRGFRLKAYEAEEVFQETVLAVYKNLPTYRAEGSLRAWIGQIAQNAARGYLRRVGRRAEVSADPDAPDEAQAAALRTVEEAVLLREALEHLSHDCRDVLRRYFYAGEKYREIAAALGIPEGTVATRISRCLVQLRGLLAE